MTGSVEEQQAAREGTKKIGRPRLETGEALARLAAVDHLPRRAQAIVLGYATPSQELHVLAMLRAQGGGGPLQYLGDVAYLTRYAEALLAGLPPESMSVTGDVDDLRDYQFPSARKRLRRHDARRRELG